MNYIVVALYKFFSVEDVHSLADDFRSVLSQNYIKGTILIANEGFNGTVCGSEIAMKNFCDFVVAKIGEKDLSLQTFESDFIPFKKTKVRIKNEIVTIKKELKSDAGEYIDANDWDNFLQEKKPILIDTRNQYEFDIGTFEGAISPETNFFSEFDSWFVKNFANKDKETPIAMFCTGGIRCEKSTKLIKDYGFKNVYHLKRGVLGYLQKTKNINGKCRGTCYVFDDRFSVVDC